MFPEGSGNPQEGCLDSLEQRKQVFGGYSQAMAKANVTLPIVGHKGHPESSRPVQTDAHGPSTLKAVRKGPIDQQETAQESMVEQGIQQHVQLTGDDVVTPAAPSIKALGSSGSSISLSGQDSSSSDTSQQPWFERVFYMAIHLNGGRIKQRVTCLDTGADVDVISHQVVEDLGLQPEKYTGNCIYPLGGEYHPEGQVTLSWHVAGFFKTYTTPFLVFNDQYSKDFDVLLGRHTIKKIGFYEKRKGVWFSAAEGHIPVPQPIST